MGNHGVAPFDVLDGGRLRRGFRTEGREEIIENMEEIIDKNGEWGGFTVFSGHSLFDTPSGGTILFVLRFYRPRCFSNALRGLHLSLHDER